ncbi:hypothetical protein ACOJTA_06350, partial [Malaciobacter sp. WC5094]
MSNEYNVVEEGVITCACGGKVTLKSSVENYTIGGKKPLYLEDLLNAPVACPRSPNANPCTKVVAISTAGTQTNVSASGKTYLLDTIGFKTDKGRAVILNNPGQTQSKISTPPSLENQVIQKEEISPIKQKEAKKLIEKEKYALYFLRQSQNKYKPLRPTRAFRKTDEKYITKNEPLDIKDNIYVHTFAYLYVKQNNKIKEYKILSKGSFYNESLKDIYFEDSKSKVKYDYIPIYEDTKIDISYSNVKLEEEKDIKKLQKLSINPKEGNKEKAFYIKDIKGIDQRSISKKELEIQKKFVPNKEGKLKRINVLCIIEDILAEIEDMYEEYYKNYKLAYAHNHSIIEDVKKQNLYTYTIANMVDIFYIDEKQKKEAKKLKDIYQELIILLLSDSIFIDILIKENNLANFLNDKNFKIAKSYVEQISYLNTDCLKDVIIDYVDKYGFETKNYYIYTNSSIKKKQLKRSQIYRQLSFYGTNIEFTKIQDDPRILISYIMFSIFFTNSYEKKLQESSNFGRLENLRKELYFLIKKMTPLPNVGSNNVRDIEKQLESQMDSYRGIIEKKDVLLEEYAYLDTSKKIYSFEQKDSNLKVKSKFLYVGKEELYKEKSSKRPSTLIKEIQQKLENDKLKELLKIYEEIKVKDKLSYVITSMNIIYLLSAPRIGIDEENEKINVFRKELNHIYEFMVNLTDIRIFLDDEIKDKLLENYTISEVYLEMQIKQINYAYLEGEEIKNKAQSFLKKYEKKQTESYFIKLEDINDHLFDEEFKTKALIETMSQTLYTINGFSSNVLDILEKMKTGRISEEYKALENFLNKLIEQKNQLRITSTLIAFITLGLYVYNKDKNFSNTMNAVTDISNIIKVISQEILKEAQRTKSIKNTKKILDKIVQDKRVQNISKKASTLASKIGVPLMAITGTYEVAKLYSNEDYDASIIAAMKTTLSIYLLISLSFAYLLIVELIWLFFSHYIIDSDIEKYLKKSLLYKTLSTKNISMSTLSIWETLREGQQEKKYQAPYLFEITNEKKELKAISSDGFNNPKRLVQFIGENYKGNEKYFDTSLKNELSFFKSSLFGYKLEETEFNSHQRVRTVSGMEISFYVQRALKIPKILADDKEFKLFFSAYGDEYFEFDANDLTKEKDYYTFDFFPKETPYIHLNQ